MGEGNESKPLSRKSSVRGDDDNGKDTINNNNAADGGGDVTLKAKMSLVNGCTVIIGSIIGRI